MSIDPEHRIATIIEWIGTLTTRELGMVLQHDPRIKHTTLKSGKVRYMLTVDKPTPPPAKPQRPARRSSTKQPSRIKRRTLRT